MCQVLPVGSSRSTACKKSQIYCLADKPSSRQVSIIVWKMADALAPAVLQKNKEFLRSTVNGRILRSANELSIV